MRCAQRKSIRSQYSCRRRRGFPDTPRAHSSMTKFHLYAQGEPTRICVVSAPMPSRGRSGAAAEGRPRGPASRPQMLGRPISHPRAFRRPAPHPNVERPRTGRGRGGNDPRRRRPAGRFPDLVLLRFNPARSADRPRHDRRPSPHGRRRVARRARRRTRGVAAGDDLRPSVRAPDDRLAGVGAGERGRWRKRRATCSIGRSRRRDESASRASAFGPSARDGRRRCGRRRRTSANLRRNRYDTAAGSFSPGTSRRSTR